MKNLLVLLLSFFCLTTIAQTKKEVKIDTSEGKYHIKIITEVNGESTTIERTYSSIEEVQNDPDLKDVKVHLLDKSKNAVFISTDEKEGDKDINVVVNVDTDTEMEGEQVHMFKFKTDGESTDEEHQIKVWIDEEGNRHVIKDGQEIESNSWTDKDGKTDEIKKGDGQVMIFSQEGLAEFKSEDGDFMDFEFSNDEGENKKLVIIRSITEGENEEGTVQKNITVKVIERINLHLEDLGENEFTEMPGVDAKVLAVDELNYYPNPNSGKFNLAFQADKKPTNIKITSTEGKEVYSEEIQGFEGSYNKEIDLTNQKRGIYLLQIIQGRKAINKKIVIE